MGKYTEFLYLNEEEMIQAGVLDAARCIDVEEEIFQLLSKGDYVMGGDKHNSHGIALKFPVESEFPNMPLDGPATQVNTLARTPNIRAMAIRGPAQEIWKCLK